MCTYSILPTNFQKNLRGSGIPPPPDLYRKKRGPERVHFLSLALCPSNSLSSCLCPFLAHELDPIEKLIVSVADQWLASAPLWL